MELTFLVNRTSNARSSNLAFLSKDKKRLSFKKGTLEEHLKISKGDTVAIAQDAEGTVYIMNNLKTNSFKFSVPNQEGASPYITVNGELDLPSGNHPITFTEMNYNDETIPVIKMHPLKEEDKE